MNKKKILFSIIFVFVLCASIAFYLNYKSIKLKVLLNTTSYSYLPKEAKNFIEETYEKTGTIALTEKNKQNNVPYLNPQYVDYLLLSEEEKSKVEEIPVSYIVDYYNSGVDGDSEIIPEMYDLRNVDGNQYITPQKNQSTVGICWAFTATELVESLLMIQNETPYNSSVEVFSPRQMDYATSNDGIKRYENEHAMRDLASGGNSLSATAILAAGVSLVHESIFPFTTSSPQKELQDVLNYDNSNYELISSETFYETNALPGSAEFEQLSNKIKYNVIHYGGAYVGTQAPGNYPCASRNLEDGSQIIRVDDSCSHDANHALQIIGWDDNYTYSYCKTGSMHSSNTWNCSQQNLVEGKGAWLLRNSWGSSSPFVYLAYDSEDSSFFSVTGVRSKDERTWDNVYNETHETTVVYHGTKAYIQVDKKVNSVEKIEQVKFQTYGREGDFKISIKAESGNYLNVRTVHKDEIGFVTVDLSDLNIYIPDDQFTVHVESTNNVSLNSYSIMVFTSNYDSKPKLKFDHFAPEETETTEKLIYFYGESKGIPSNEEIDFKLFDDTGNEVTQQMNVEYNKIAKNNINALITLDEDIPSNIYTIKAYYDDSEYESKIIVDTPFILDGDGTEASPFLIRTEEDLRKVSLFMSSYYSLENDIVLTEKWVPIGIESNPFKGVFNGNNHTIENIIIDDDYDNAGFFGVVEGTSSTIIKNLTLKNANVKGIKDSAILVGMTIGEDGYGNIIPTSNLTIDNVSIINGNIYSTNQSAGSIIGKIKGLNSLYIGNHNYTINRAFTNATVGGKTSTGIIGEVTGTTSTTYKPTISMNHIENLGIIDLNTLINENITPVSNTHASVLGNTTGISTFNLNYYILSPLFRGTTYQNNGLLGTISNTTTTNITNGYNVLDNNTTILDLKNETNYSTWTNFNNYWKIETVNSIKRIPILMNANIDYTNVSNITLEHGSTLIFSNDLGSNLLSRLNATTQSSPGIINATNLIDTSSNQVYDLELSTITSGELMLHLVSDYDGYENDILITVIVSMTDFTIPESSIKIDIGDTYLVEPVYTPSNTTESKVISWTNTNPEVATINNSGLITGIDYGTTTITGTLENNKSVTITVKVIQIIPITSFIISNENITLNPDSSWTLAALISPSNTSDEKTISWTSSDEEVATVDEYGTVTGVSEGIATITGTLENGMTITSNVEITNTEITHYKGDLTYDNVVDLNDILMAIRKIFLYTPTDTMDLSVGDVTDDEKIDLEDVIRMLRYVFRYIQEL